MQSIQTKNPINVSLNGLLGENFENTAQNSPKNVSFSNYNLSILDVALYKKQIEA